MNYLLNNIKAFNGKTRKFDGNTNVHISDGVIKKVSNDIIKVDVETEILDCSGFYGIPGILDIHTHTDFTSHSPIADMYSFNMGVTHQVTGLCGFHPVYSESQEKEKFKKSVSFLGDDSSVVNDWYEHDKRIKRSYVKKYQLLGLNSLLYGIHDLTNNEAYEKVKRELVKYDFHGVSLGIFYPPFATLPKDRLFKLMKILVKKIDLPFFYHVRDQRDYAMESYKEVFEFHKGTTTRCHISHLKFSGSKHTYKINERLKELERLISSFSFPVSWDAYPFGTSATTISSLLPELALMDTEPEHIDIDRFKKKLENKTTIDWENAIVRCNTSYYNDKSISNIAKEMNLSNAEAYVKVVLDVNSQGVIMRKTMDEEDVMAICEHPKTIIASDSFGLSSVHPRNYLTYKKYLKEAFDKGKLEQAVNKLTFLPREIFNNIPTGIEEDQKADLVVLSFDNNNFLDLDQSVTIHQIFSEGRMISNEHF